MNPSSPTELPLDTPAVRKAFNYFSVDMTIMVSIPLPFNENPFGINIDVEISVAKENGISCDPFNTYNNIIIVATIFNTMCLFT